MRRWHRLAGIFFCLTALSIPSISSSWVENGVAVCTATGEQYPGAIACDVAGGAIITWLENAVPEDNHICAQKLDMNGAAQWGSGVSLPGDRWDFNPQLVPDGSGGFFVTWYGRNAAMLETVYAARIRSNGNVQGISLWTEYGIGFQGYPKITTDGEGGAIITWQEYRTGGTDSDIYTQRIDSSGAAQWTANGIAVCTAAGWQNEPQIAPDGAGGAIITWDLSSGYSNIYAQAVDAGGTVRWTADGVEICTASYDQENPQIIPDGSGGAIIAWQDERSGSIDIYAQRINAAGAVQWTANGITVCTADSDQDHPFIVPSGAGGAIIVWRDLRGGNEDIYAQRIDSNGSIQWTTNGIPICTGAGEQRGHRVVCDDAGGAIIVWVDGRGDDLDIFAQRIDANGNVLWTPGGVEICTAVGNQDIIESTSDGNGGAVISWRDSRSGDWDIYALGMDGDGQSVATLLQNHSAYSREFDIVISWTVSKAGEGMEFFISRAEGCSDLFREIVCPEITNVGLSFSFVDEECEPGASYRYRLEVSDETGRRILFETATIRVPVSALALHQNHPNPFNPVTSIRYHLPDRCRVLLNVYDISGRKIYTLVDEEQAGGTYKVEWNGTDTKGNQSGSGIYIYRLKAGKQTISRKMILLR